MMSEITRYREEYNDNPKPHEKGPWVLYTDHLAAIRRAKAEVWPKVNAPAMYDNPDPGWEDTRVPDIARIWQLAREVGYAVGLHGSLKRDMDLIAAPWTDEAVGNAELVEHLCAGLPATRIGGPEHRPHGRVAVTLQLDGYFKPIDLSIMPRLATNGKAEGIREVEQYARACVHERAVQLDGWIGSSEMAGVIRGKQSEADRIADWADARAAQIEGGA